MEHAALRELRSLDMLQSFEFEVCDEGIVVYLFALYFSTTKAKST